MTIIDMHGHIGTWHNFFIPQPSARWLVETSGAVGIAATGVSHLMAFGYDTVAGNQLALDAARAHPGRLGVWLVANPHRRDDVQLIREQLSLPHVWGLKLHPDVHQYPITGPGYEPYLLLARDAAATVLTHGETRSPWSDPDMVAAVARRIPGLALLMAHAGVWRDGFERAADIAAEVPDLFIEVCGSRVTSAWVTRFVEIVGAEKVVFGTDASFLDPRTALGKVLHARLSDRDRALVLGGNAVRLLGDRRLRVDSLLRDLAHPQNRL